MSSKQYLKAQKLPELIEWLTKLQKVLPTNTDTNIIHIEVTAGDIPVVKLKVKAAK